MAIHDISDPFLESAKLFLYMNKIKIANIIFVIFVFIFVVSRLIIFPCIAIFPVIDCFFKVKDFKIFVCAFFLLLLFFLHVYWCFMVFKTAVKIFGKREYEDARSEN